MNILIFSGLKDDKLISKISPLVSLENVEDVYLVRNSELQYAKVKSMSPPAFLNVFIVREFIKLFFGFYVCLFKEIDYVIGIFLRPHGIFAYLAGILFRKPVIQVFVGNDVDFIEKHRKLFKGLLKRAKKIGVRGSCSKKRLVDLVKQESKFFIHHNVFSPLSLNQGMREEKKSYDIVCVADFSRVKRIDVFLKVISRIKEKYPGVKAVMVGANGKRRFYERMKKRMKLERNVSFVGAVGDVYAYLRKSRVFMITSEAEGLPMSIIESMSVGLPCVVPKVGDIPDLTKDGFNAHLVNPLDVEAFASSSLQLLEDEELYNKISHNALNTVREKSEEFSLQYNQKVWSDILG